MNKYTSQYHEDYTKLLWYNSRFYDPSLGRFVQADTIIPGHYNSLSWDRFAYVTNNPTRYIDPSGHRACEKYFGECTGDPPRGYSVRELYGPPRLDPTPTAQPRPNLSDVLTPVPTDITQIEHNDSDDDNSLPRLDQSLTRDEVLALLVFLRSVCGKCDPAIPDAFTGTSLGYMDIVRNFTEGLPPGHPWTPFLRTVAHVVPPACTGYNFVYDQVTDTGEYSSIEIPKPTPTQAIISTVTIILILTFIPIAFPPP